MVDRELPAGRYGSRSTTRWPRWAYWLGLTTFVLVAGVVAVVGYRNLGGAPIEGKQNAFVVLDDGSVRIRFDVARDQPDRAAVCVVRARAQDGDEVGRREVYVPAGSAGDVVTTVVRTATRSVSGEVFGCSYQVPPYLPKGRPPSG